MVAASACSFPDPALSSHLFCLQHQMAGQSLFKMATSFLGAGLIPSAASWWLGIFPANYGHFCLERSLRLYCGRAVPVIPRVLGKRWLQDRHLCVIAEAVLEPQLLLRKAESAKSSVALFCQVSP